MRVDQAAKVLREALDRHDAGHTWCAAHGEGQWCCVDKKANRGSGIIEDNEIRQAIERLMPLDPEQLRLIGQRVPETIEITIRWPGGNSMEATALFTGPDTRANLDMQHYYSEADDAVSIYAPLELNGLHDLTLRLENVRFA